MAVLAQIEADLKTALLAGDKSKAEALRTIKSSLQYEAVALGAKDAGLTDDQIFTVLNREVKKRAEAAELYQKAGENDRANISPHTNIASPRTNAATKYTIPARCIVVGSSPTANSANECTTI